MDCNVSRRRFLKLCGATVGAAVLGSTAVSSKELLRAAGASRTKYAMAVNLKACEETEACDGTKACVHACKTVNITPPNSYWMQVLESDHITFADRLPRPCMQCDNPPCVKVCPVGATYKRMDGIILVDYFRCIGCRLCAVSCPYGARSFNWSSWATKESVEKTRNNSWAKVKAVWEMTEEGVPPENLIEDPPIEIPRPAGVIEKCNFCLHRIEKGKEPACVVSCPSKALIFGDTGDPGSEVSKTIEEEKWIRLLEEFNTKPAVFYFR